MVNNPFELRRLKPSETVSVSKNNLPEFEGVPVSFDIKIPSAPDEDTSSLVEGLVVPIPTLPEELM